MRVLARDQALDERRAILKLISTVMEPHLSAPDKQTAVCPLKPLVEVISSVFPRLTEKHSEFVIKAICGNTHEDNIRVQQAGMLSWLLHANCNCRYITSAKLPTKEHAERGGRDWPALRQVANRWRAVALLGRACAMLSFALLIVAAWLPDPGLRWYSVVCVFLACGFVCPSLSCCTKASAPEIAHLFSVPGEGHWPPAMECTANRVLEWLDILIFGVLLVEVVCMIANQVSWENQRLYSRCESCMSSPAQH